MTDEELKTYYIKQEEEKERRKRIKAEIKEEKTAEIRAKILEEHKKEMERNPRESDGTIARKFVVYVIILGAIYVWFCLRFINSEDILMPIIVFMLMGGWVVIPYIPYVFKE